MNQGTIPIPTLTAPATTQASDLGLMPNADKLRFILFQTQARHVPKAYRIDRVDEQSLDYTRIATRDGVGEDVKGRIEWIQVVDGVSSDYKDAFRFSFMGQPLSSDRIIKVHSWALATTEISAKEFDRLPEDTWLAGPDKIPTSTGYIRWDG